MKKTRKLVTYIILTAIMITTCLGCSNEKKSEKPPQPEIVEKEQELEDKPEIHIFQYKVEIEDSLEQACNLYTKEHPDVTIHLETIGGSNSYGDALKEKIQSGETVDIFNIEGPEDCQTYQEMLEDLSNQPWVEHAAEGVLDDVTVEKEIYGLPYGLEGYGLIYNKRIFEAAGINVLELTDYEAIHSAFTNLQRKIANGELKEQFPLLTSVTEMAGGESWVIGTHTGNAVLSNEFKNASEAYQAKTVAFKYADQYQKLIDLQADFTRYSNHKSFINNIMYQDQINSIALERVAVIQQGNWVSGEIEAISSEVSQQLGILPLSLYNVNENSIPVGVPRYWCVNKDSSDVNKAAAKDFLNWLYQSDTGKSIIINEFGFIPAFQNYEDYPVKDVLGRAVMRYVNAGQITNWVSSGLPVGWSSESLGKNIEKYLAGNMTWKEVMDTAKKDWEQIRKE